MKRWVVLLVVVWWFVTFNGTRFGPFFSYEACRRWGAQALVAGIYGSCQLDIFYNP